jgi:hypothetical protein
LDYCSEGGGGGYEEGLHREGEASEGVEAGIGAVDDCSALGNMLVVCILKGISIVVVASKGTL